jgi:hypothetical protein
VPFQEFPASPTSATLEQVTERLDPVLVPLGFAEGQVGTSADEAQVIFCRGFDDSPDEGCVDLVIDLRAAPDWRIVGVRYWGFAEDRWRLSFARDASLAAQLNDLAETLPDQLT